MRRWALPLLLLLSLGINLGVIGMVAFEKARFKPSEPPSPELPPGPAGGDLIARLPRFADTLGLEGGERQKFLDIHVAFFQDTGRLRLRQAEVQRDLRRELSGSRPDRARIDKLLREAADLFLKMEQSFAKSVLDSRQLLGDEQERRYLRVVARLRGTVQRDLEIAPREGGQPPEGLGPAGRPRPTPLRPERREGGVPFRPDGLDNPDAGPPPQAWPERMPEGRGPGGALQQERLRRLRWRQLQRERLLQQRRAPGRQPPAAEVPATPPPPIY